MVRPVQGHPGAAAAGTEETPRNPALEKAAAEMEAVFIRQLLAAAKIGGQSSDSGYGAMAVDALATGIQNGGGIGLARRIEEALADPRVPPPAETK